MWGPELVKIALIPCDPAAAMLAASRTSAPCYPVPADPFEIDLPIPISASLALSGLAEPAETVKPVAPSKT